MVNVALIGPKYNGLNKYLAPLCSKLLEKGHSVTRLGFEDICFDVGEITYNVNKLIEVTDWNEFDVLHYHYGTYDAEQLIPVFLKNQEIPSILTVHSLELELFKKLKEDNFYKLVNEQAKTMEGFCFFTKYAKNKMNIKSKPNIIAWHPATHENISVGSDSIGRFAHKWGIDLNRPIVTILGYPSHWKTVTSLISAAKKMKDVQFVFGGPWWTRKIEREGELLLNTKIIDKELDEQELITLVEMGVGLFPYREHQSFQGSGLLPNYLSRGKTCIVSNIAPLKEYIDGNSEIVDLDNEKELINSIQLALSKPNKVKSQSFSYEEHVNLITKFYEEIGRCGHENTILS